MSSSTPDWSALASQHERLADQQSDAGPSGPAPLCPPGAQHQVGQPARHRGVPRPRWRGRVARGAAAATTAVLVAGGAGTASASAASSPSWHIVKQVHAGDSGIPHTTQVLGGGFTHAFNNPGANVVAVILQYKS